mgnify:FL=1
MTMMRNGLIDVDPVTQFEYGDTVRSTNARPLQTPVQSQQNSGLLDLLTQLGVSGMSRDDIVRMERSGMDPMNPSDVKRYNEAMSSLSGRIGNLGDRIMNVPDRVVETGRKGREAIPSLFDLFGGK